MHPQRRSQVAGRHHVAGPPVDVVYVEDDDRVRMMYRVNLAAEGFLVREAADGEEAMRLIAQRVPDIVLADVFMPRMDGVELATRIRDEVRPVPPIVFLSANPMSIDEEMLRLVGDEYLRKPFPPTALGARLRRVLDRTATRRAS